MTTTFLALVAAVRDGEELSPERRRRLAALLIDVDTAVKLAARVREYHRDSDAAKVGYLIGNWQMVITAYAELAATVASRDGECAA